jgi:hypothetical protein
LKSLSEGSKNPFWERLFALGGSEWAFQIRKGDAKSFLLLGICFWREGFEVAFGPEADEERAGWSLRRS